MLTRQGWAAVWGAMALFAAGRLLGISELYVFGTVGVLLLLGALAYVHLVSLDLEADRQIHPHQVHAGGTSRVEVHIRNLRTRPTPPLRLHDQVSDTDGAEMLVPPLDTRDSSTTSYRLPTTRRGVLQVGPLSVAVSDPFGLARSTIEAAGQVDVTVFPRIDRIRPVPFSVGHDPTAGAVQQNTLTNSGDDFFALRPYVMGDDLRRIHWPSTARHDELLVRQHEQPWQGRTTVLVDLSTDAYTPESLEVAISAAASIATANGKRGDLVRLITSDGRDSGFGVGHTHLRGILEHLALADVSTRTNLTATVEVLQRGKGSGGALAAVVGELTPERGTALTQVSRRAGSFTRVEVARIDAAGGGRDVPAPARAGPRSTGEATVVRVGAGAPFATAWERTVRRSGPGRASAAPAQPGGPR